MRSTGEGIECPVCGSFDHSVKDSRGGIGYWRRRRLCKCGERFTTVEIHVAHVRHGAPYMPGLDLQRKLSAMPDRQRKLIEHLIWEFGPRKEPLPVDCHDTRAHDGAATTAPET